MKERPYSNFEGNHRVISDDTGLLMHFSFIDFSKKILFKNGHMLRSPESLALVFPIDIFAKNVLLRLLCLEQG